MRVARSCLFSLFTKRPASNAISVFWRRQSSLTAATEEGIVSSAERTSKELKFESAGSSQLSSSVNLDAAKTLDNVSSIRRVWKRSLSGSHCMHQDRFTVTSFNILASEHAYRHRHLYSSLHASYLHWSRRRTRVIRGLEACCPDIICLQEVDQFNDLREGLALRGFAGLHKRRPGETADGLAIFWKTARFRLLQERGFDFAMLDMRNNVAQLCVLQLIETDEANNPVWSRPDDQNEGRFLVVGNIHVLYNPKRGDIKLGQCRAFLEQVHNMSSIWHDAPVVIGGDFNSTPSSAIYNYLATSELELANLDRRFISGINLEKIGQIKRNQVTSIPQRKATEMLENPGSFVQQAVLNVKPNCNDDSSAVDSSNLELPEIVFDGSSESVLTASVREYWEFSQEKDVWDVEELRIATGKDDCTLVRHELKLSSTYSDIQGDDDTRDVRGEPLITTCTNKFFGTVDYIWRNDGLETLGVLDTLPSKCFAEARGLLLKVWGSDHLPLACELAFAQKNGGQNQI